MKAILLLICLFLLPYASQAAFVVKNDKTETIVPKQEQQQPNVSTQNTPEGKKGGGWGIASIIVPSHSLVSPWPLPLALLAAADIKRTVSSRSPA